MLAKIKNGKFCSSFQMKVESCLELHLEANEWRCLHRHQAEGELIKRSGVMELLKLSAGIYSEMNIWVTYGGALGSADILNGRWELNVMDGLGDLLRWFRGGRSFWEKGLL